MGFFNSTYFDAHWKKKVVICQCVMTLVIFCLGIAKIVTRPSHIPMNRMDIVAITMSVKSAIILAYEILSEHRQRWVSLKAYAVLNTIEVVFWFAVVILSFMGVSKVCVGANCGIGVVIGLLALVNVGIFFWAAVITWKDHKYFKRTGAIRGRSIPQHRSPAYATDSSPSMMK
ncbi:hypothetical protein HJFPF1_02113 [Paramyrothecium foliicola]|nr:hypothetical protein HJFPF1_02113 [Paramyrothecium foliicola]